MHGAGKRSMGEKVTETQEIKSVAKRIIIAVLKPLKDLSVKNVTLC